MILPCIEPSCVALLCQSCQLKARAWCVMVAGTAATLHGSCCISWPSAQPASPDALLFSGRDGALLDACMCPLGRCELLRTIVVCGFHVITVSLCPIGADGQAGVINIGIGGASCTQCGRRCRAQAGCQEGRKASEGTVPAAARSKTHKASRSVAHGEADANRQASHTMQPEADSNLRQPSCRGCFDCGFVHSRDNVYDRYTVDSGRCSCCLAGDPAGVRCSACH